MKKLWYALAAAIFCFAVQTELRAQSFTSAFTWTGVNNADADWADFNNDGWPDFAVAGSGSFKLYSNTSGTSFTDVTSTYARNITGVDSGAVKFADYDNDGDQDLVVLGRTGSGTRTTTLYKNGGSGNNWSFTSSGLSLPGMSDGDVAWCDYDRDGDLDITICGINSSGAVQTLLYNNSGIAGGFTFQASGLYLVGLHGGNMDWSDFNRDGYPDLLICGTSSYYPGGAVYLLWNYQGESLSTHLDIEGAGVYGNAQWCDFNLDGWTDFVATGNGSGYTTIYQSNSANNFSEYSLGISQITNGAAKWGDCTNDGYPDFALNGMTFYPTSVIVGDAYVSASGSGSFSGDSDGLPFGYGGDMEWCDFDRDGDLDILMAMTGSSTFLSIYKNSVSSSTRAGTPPAPGNVTATVAGRNVLLKWDKNSPDPTLTYNIMVGSAANPVQIVSPASNAGTGYLLCPKPGNAGYEAEYLLTNVPNGTWQASVQAVSPAYNGSAFTASISFTVTGTLNKAIIEVTGNNPYCTGGTVPTLTAYSYPQAQGYEWMQAMGTSSYSGGVRTQSYTPPYAGNYYCVVTTMNGTRLYSDTVAVTQLPVPGVPIAPDVTTCNAGQPVILTAVPGSNGNTCQWYNTSGIFLHTGTSYQVSVSSNTNFRVYSYDSINGCKGSTYTTQSVSVQGSISSPSWSILSDCSTSEVTLNLYTNNGTWCRLYSGSGTSGAVLADGPTPLSYSWPFLANTTLVTAQAYAPSGGCTSAAVTIAVSPPQTVSRPSVTDARICAPGTITLHAHPGSGANTCRWYKTPTDTSPFRTDTVFTINPLHADTAFWVSSYNSSTGCESVARMPIHADVDPVLAKPIAQSVTQYASSAFILEARVTGSDNTCKWYSNASRTTLVHTGTTCTTPVLHSTTDYYITAWDTVSLCEGDSVTHIQAIVATPPQRIYNPDFVYPIASNFGDKNFNGVNLSTGDLNLTIPLITAENGKVTWPVSLFYNSHSAYITPYNSSGPAGGPGWKLLDYPKIAWDASGMKYVYLDGLCAYELHLQSQSGANYYYTVSGPGYLYTFRRTGGTSAGISDDWRIVTDQGIQYEMTNNATSSLSGSQPGNIWNLSKIVDTQHIDSLLIYYNSDGLLSYVEAKGNFKYNFNYSTNSGVNSLFNITRVKIDNTDQTIYQDAEIRISYAATFPNTTLKMPSAISWYGFTGAFLLGSTQPELVQLSPPTQFAYNAAGMLQKMTNPSGSWVTFDYGNRIIYGLVSKPVKEINSYSGMTYKMDKTYWLEHTVYSLNYEGAVKDNHNTYTFYNKAVVYPGQGSSVSEITGYASGFESGTSDPIFSDLDSDEFSTDHVLAGNYSYYLGSFPDPTTLKTKKLTVDRAALATGAVTTSSAVKYRGTLDSIEVKYYIYNSHSDYSWDHYLWVEFYDASGDNLAGDSLITFTVPKGDSVDQWIPYAARVGIPADAVKFRVWIQSEGWHTLENSHFWVDEVSITGAMELAQGVEEYYFFNGGPASGLERLPDSYIVQHANDSILYDWKTSFETSTSYANWLDTTTHHPCNWEIQLNSQSHNTSYSGSSALELNYCSSANKSQLSSEILVIPYGSKNIRLGFHYSAAMVPDLTFEVKLIQANGFGSTPSTWTVTTTDTDTWLQDGGWNYFEQVVPVISGYNLVYFEINVKGIKSGLNYNSFFIDDLALSMLGNAKLLPRTEGNLADSLHTGKEYKERIRRADNIEITGKEYVLTQITPSGSQPVILPATILEIVQGSGFKTKNIVYNNKGLVSLVLSTQNVTDTTGHIQRWNEKTELHYAYEYYPAFTSSQLSMLGNLASTTKYKNLENTNSWPIVSSDIVGYQAFEKNGKTIWAPSSSWSLSAATTPSGVASAVTTLATSQNPTLYAPWRLNQQALDISPSGDINYTINGDSVLQYNVYSNTLYQSNSRNQVRRQPLMTAKFVNGTPQNSFYYGFECYESTQLLTFNVTGTESWAFAGQRSASGTMSMSFTVTTHSDSVLYVFSGRVLPTTSNVSFNVSGTTNGTLVSQSQTYSSSQQNNWQYFEYLFKLPPGSDHLTFRISPLTSSSSNPGVYADNLRFSPAACQFIGMTWNDDNRLMIQTEDNQSASERTLYNVKGLAKAEVTDGEAPLSISMQEYSSSIPTNNAAFNPASPGQTTLISARGTGKYYPFNSPGNSTDWYLTSATAAGMEGLSLNSQGSARLNSSAAPANWGDFGLSFQTGFKFSTQTTYGTEYLYINMGGSSVRITYTLYSGAGLNVYAALKGSSGGYMDTKVFSQPSTPIGEVPVEISVIWAGTSVHLWVNGMLVQTLSNFTPAGSNNLTISRGTSSFMQYIYIREVMIFNDPLVEMTFTNGWDLTIQEQSLAETGIMASAKIYDEMAREAITTKQVLMTSRTLGFKSSLITSFDWASGALSGDICDYATYTDNVKDSSYFYQRKIYQPSPDATLQNFFQSGYDFALRSQTGWEKAQSWCYYKIPEYVEEFNEFMTYMQYAGIAMDIVDLVLEPETAPLMLALDVGFLLLSQIDFSTSNESGEYPVTTYYYDPEGRMIQIGTPNANLQNDPITAQKIKMQYDYTGNMTKLTRPESGAVTFVYDAGNRVRFVQDAAGAAQNPPKYQYMKYDQYGRVTEEGTFAEIASAYTLQQQANQADFPQSGTANKIISRTKTYDGAGTSSEGTRYVRGQLTTCQIYENGSPVSTATMTYDSRGRLTQVNETFRVGGSTTLSFITTWGINNLDGVTSVSLVAPGKSAVQFNYSYNKTGLMSAVRNTSESSNFCTWQFNPDGSIARQTFGYPNGSTLPLVNSWTGSGWLSKQVQTGFGEIDLTYNKAPNWWAGLWDQYYYNGNIFSSTYTPASGTAVECGFDYTGTRKGEQYYSNVMNNLLIEDDEDIPFKMKYDASGNLTSRKFTYINTNVRPNRTYEMYQYWDYHHSLNQPKLVKFNEKWDGDMGTQHGRDSLSLVMNLSGLTTNSNYADYDLDYDTELLNRINRTITWNSDQMPATVTTSTSRTNTSSSLSFVYNDDGRRIIKRSRTTTNNSLTQNYLKLYVRGGQEVPMMEYIYDSVARTTTVRYFVQGIKETLGWYDATGSSTSSYFVLHDERGSALKTVNRSTKAVGNSYTYDQYGSLLTAGPAATGYTYLYTGQEFDPETGFYNYNARMYDPMAALFLSPDPAMSDPGTPYAYADNDPVNKTDPTGLSFLSIIQIDKLLDGLDLGQEAVSGAIDLLEDQVKTYGLMMDEATFEGYLDRIEWLYADFDDAAEIDDYIMEIDQAAPNGNTIAPSGSNPGLNQYAKVNSRNEVYHVELTVSMDEWKEAAQHFADYGQNNSTVFTIDRGNAAPRRRASTSKLAPSSLKDRDEVPPAMFKEGGHTASVRYMDIHDNRASGSWFGRQLRTSAPFNGGRWPDGTKVFFNVVPSGGWKVKF